MKLFYFYTDDPDYLKLQSLFENNLKEQNLQSFSYKYQKLNKKIARGGGYLGWERRYETILKGFENTKLNEFFICCDIDIRFYKDIYAEISKLIEEYPHIQLWFQKEHLNHGINIGFMVIKNTELTRNFFRIANEIISKNIWHDINSNRIKIKHPRRKNENYTGAGQDWVNDIIYNKSVPIANMQGWFNQKLNINWNRLPNVFWHPIFKKPSQDTIIYHHATCESNLKQKIKKLNYE